jgi:hypothetical protein
MRRSTVFILIILLAGSLAAEDVARYYCSPTNQLYLDKNKCSAECASNGQPVQGECQLWVPPDYSGICLSAFAFVVVFLVVFVGTDPWHGMITHFIDPQDVYMPKFNKPIEYRDRLYRWFHIGGSFQGVDGRYYYQGSLVSANKKFRSAIRSNEVMVEFDSAFKSSPRFRLRDIKDELAATLKQLKELKEENAALSKQYRDATLDVLDHVKDVSFKVGKVGESIHLAPVIVSGKSTGTGYSFDQKVGEGNSD